MHAVPCQAGGVACSANGVSSTSMSPGGSTIVDMVSMRNASGVLGLEKKEAVHLLPGLVWEQNPSEGPGCWLSEIKVSA